MQSDFSNFEGRQIAEEFIRDSVSRKASKTYSKNLATGRLVVFDRLSLRLTA